MYKDSLFVTNVSYRMNGIMLIVQTVCRLCENPAQSSQFFNESKTLLESIYKIKDST